VSRSSDACPSTARRFRAWSSGPVEPTRSGSGRTRRSAGRAKPTLTGEWTVPRWTARQPGEVSARTGHDPTIGGLIVTLRDITERRRLEHEAAWRFVHDPLTGLTPAAVQ
jgi:hypothetical protein